MVFSISASAQQPYLIPAVYRTSGTYSNGTTSSSTDGYALAQLGGDNFLSATAGRLNIDASSWTYEQSLLALSGTKNLYPFFLTVRLGLIGGDYSAKQYQYTYSDKISVLSGTVGYNWELFTFRADYTNLNLRGYKNVVSRQASCKIEWIASESMSVSAAPLYSTLSSGRKPFRCWHAGIVRSLSFAHTALLRFQRATRVLLRSGYSC